MPRKVLVIGGSRYFGKRLVSLLLARGDEVTLLNRGKAKDEFGDRVKRIRMDRGELCSGHPALGESQWDVVYDQVCYEATDARSACNALNGRVGRFIVTSSQSVYGPGQAIDERAFNPRTYKFAQAVSAEVDYAEAKRQVEASYFASADAPVITVRFPIVLGEDDYTGRLKFHVRHVAEKLPIYFPDISARISLISSTDAASFLDWLSDQALDGPINCASAEPIALSALMNQIEVAVGIQAKLAATPGTGELSPFGADADWYMSTERLSICGFECKPLDQWLPQLIQLLAKLGR